MNAKPSTVILILAAGASVRFGGPKALARWGQGTLLSQAVATSRLVPNASPLVVLGAYAEIYESALDCEHISNPGWQQGMGASVAAGARAALARYPALDALVILPVDQPMVTSSHLEKIIHMATAEQHCIFTKDDEITGPPVAVPANYFLILTGLTGDTGLKSTLSPEDKLYCEATGMLADIDTPQDLEKLQRL